MAQIKNQTADYSIREYLLTYIGYILPKMGRRFSYETCSRIFKKLGINHQISTLHKEFSLLKKEGLIDFELYYHRNVPFLTSSGRLAIKTKLVLRHFDTWDGLWRLVIFDLPAQNKNDRIKLTDKLSELGFRKIQKSTYLSPYPLVNIVSRFANDLGIRQYLNFFEVSNLYDQDKILEKWQIETINSFYQKFLKRAIVSKSPEWPLKAKILEREFAQIYYLDPHLPTKLLPQDWLGQTAYQKFKMVSNSY